MTHFTVEITVEVPTDGGFPALRRILDIVPGSFMIEDPEEPTMFVPVEAAEPMRAVMFVDGLSKLTGIKINSGQVYATPDIDHDVEDQPDAPTTAVERHVWDWMNAVPDIEGRVAADGKLCDA